jgi:ketosteroid isomerase-like protein
MRIFGPIIFIFCVLLIWSCGHQDNYYSALQAMVESERAFAKISADSGMRLAFMTYLADEAIVFRPEPVKGKERYVNSPEVPGMLIWQPVFADVSRDGKLGYTTGPWEFRQENKDDSADAYGDYISVWKKQADLSWKVVVDVGVSHPHPGYDLRNVNLETEHPVVLLGRKINQSPKIDGTVLLKIDRDFSSQAEGLGIQITFQTMASPEVRLYRDGIFPLVGLEFSLTYLSDFSGKYYWTPLAAEVASSADLGYSYGTGEYAIETIDSLAVERFSYLRIWKIDHLGSWKLILEVTNPIPSPVADSPSPDLDSIN